MAAMDEIRKTLSPLTDWMPPDVRDWLPVEAWWMILLVLALLALLLVGHLLRGLFRRRPRQVEWDTGLRLDLDECPLPAGPPGNPVLFAYHLPVQLRLVVLAPTGKEANLDGAAVERLLDRLVPGLAAVARNDRPLIRVWPRPLSHQGFINSFHRCTTKREPDTEPSRWILLAGRTQGTTPPVLLGLGLWAEEANTVGRLNLQPHQWLDVLRLRPAER
jgi:hypothetical protein